MEPWKKAQDILDRISMPCPIDDAPKIYTHIDENGNRMLVSIPDNERDDGE